jgi:hypothetical protein
MASNRGAGPVSSYGVRLKVAESHQIVGRSGGTGTAIQSSLATG